MINEVFSFFTIVSSIIFLILAIYTYRYRESPGGIPFFGAMILLSFLGIASVGELVANNIHTKVWWRNFQQIPLFACPVLMYILILQFIGKEKSVIIRRSLLLSAPIFVYLVLIFTDEWHHLMRKEIIVIPHGHFKQTVVYSKGLSLLFILYGRSIVIASLATLFLNIKKVSVLNRKQYYILIFATLIPYTFTFVPETSYLKVNTAIASIPMGFLYFYALFKYKLLLVHPVANDKIIENIKEGIVVLDKHDIITQLNPLSKLILHQICDNKDKVFIGESLLSLLKTHGELNRFYNEKRDQEKEIIIADSYYKVAFISVAFTNHNKGVLLIFTDITVRKKYEEYLLKKATIDSLTQVYNRQYMEEATVEQINEVTKTGQCVSFILLDIDKFKWINDTYGHQSGDHVLEKFAQSLKENVAHLGIISRVGGEEFAVLLPYMGIEEAYKLAEEIRKNIAKIRIWIEGGNEEFTLTVSIGVTATSDPKMTFKEIFSRADHALYESKNNGRNQTTVNLIKTKRKLQIDEELIK
jgi:diguanylate cyclase (GGDEF)-like protein